MMYLDEEIIESQKDLQPMPYQRIEEQEAAGFLTQIVATLPSRQQEVLQLKFQNDLSYQQIAEITKTTANCVGVLIHTALKTLRQRYRDAMVASGMAEGVNEGFDRLDELLERLAVPAGR